MKWKYECDRCGQRITGDAYVQNVSRPARWARCDTREYHLCSSCSTEFFEAARTWIDTGMME